MRFTLLATSGRARRGRLEAARTAPSRRRRSCRSAPTARSRRWRRTSWRTLGAQIVLGNTFHLWLRPGVEVDRARTAGCTASWAGTGRSSPTPAASRCAASGALRKVREEGVTFASPVNGDRLLLTPEISMQIQRALDSDIAMVFDECTPYPATRDEAADVDGAVAALGAPRRATSSTRWATPTRSSASCRAGCSSDLRDESLAGLVGHRLRRLRHRRPVGRRAEGRDARACSATRRRGCRRTGRAT